MTGMKGHTQFGFDHVLGLSHRHTVARDNNNTLYAVENHGSFVCAGAGYFAGINLIRVHGRAAFLCS